jgi:hypothetical protein
MKGFVINRIYHGGGGPYKGARTAPFAVDIEAIVGTGGTTRWSGATDLGCPFVVIDWANTVEGELPTVLPVEYDVAIQQALIGVITDNHDDLDAGAKCTVRIWGVHDKAAVEGTNNVAIGDRLQAHADDGQVEQTINETTGQAQVIPAGYAMATQAASSSVATKVFINNPFGIPI